jgi:hypothetical protein
MTILDATKNKISDLVVQVRRRAGSDGHKTESDVAPDPHVASSRAGQDGDDGEYVGRTGPDVALDVEQSGAEARSEQKRLAP